VELKALIHKARAGDVSAFTELTRRYQNIRYRLSPSLFLSLSSPRRPRSRWF